MRKSVKILLIVFTLALLASVFLSSVAFAEQVQPWNVVADIRYGNAAYHYDLAKNAKNCDNAENRELYSSAKMKKQLAENLLRQNLPEQAVYEYVLCGFRDVVEFFGFVNVERRDATVRFGKSGFHYTEGVDGVAIDCDKLFYLLLNSNGKCINVQLPLSHDKAVSVADLKQNTVKKATFTTYYAASGPNRCHNIAVATKALDGVTVGVGEKFSFNDIVGARTEENGYKQSKVILDGAYTDGVGGGVCQVSTTLYNALLLSEILPKANQHSLVSSYVLAGFDAMVSDGGADLTFVNDTDYPLYISGKVNSANKSVTFTVYGKPNVYRIERESVETRQKFDTVEIVDSQKYPELVYTDQIKVVCAGSDGVRSKSYLNYYDGETLAFRKLIRQNVYKKVDKIVARGNIQRETDGE